MTSLDSDVKTLINQDKTIIGDRGMSLSGG